MSSKSIIHLFRHGSIPGHFTDHSLTAKGEKDAFNAGKKLAEQIQSNDKLQVYCSPSRRTRQTAKQLLDGLANVKDITNLALTAHNITVDDRLQNMQFFIDGLNYEPIVPMLDVVQWRFLQTPSKLYETHIKYQTEFWTAPDPIGYWLTHPADDVIETPEAVVKRTLSFIFECNATSESGGVKHHIGITHSSNLRSLLLLVLGNDPGSPLVNEDVTILSGKVYFRDQVGSLNGNEYLN